jgi:inositol-phosphate transport system ATP-binding protein
MKVNLQNISKYFGNVQAVDNLNLDIKDGEFVAFLGPSGCGKTTTLLMVAGIYKPSSGRITFDDRVVNSTPPKDRNIGMVFQSYALYPHMTAYENLIFPMKLKKVPEKYIKERVAKVAEMMGISPLLERKPGELSGGQQQRIALGRALAKEPALLLFDEPLSNLDARLRLSMRSEIKRLQMQLGITSIYVTHDQVEAMTLADRIAVMKDGKLQAYCGAEELYDRPPTTFVAGFVGNPPINLFDAEVSKQGDNFIASTNGLSMLLPADRGQKAAGLGMVTVGIRPESIGLADEGPDGEVWAYEPLGRDDVLDVHIGGISLNMLVEPALKIRSGDHVRLTFDTSKVQLFDRVSGKSLLWLNTSAG